MRYEDDDIDRKNYNPEDNKSMMLYIIAFIFCLVIPPLAVLTGTFIHDSKKIGIHDSKIGVHFWINVILTLLGFIPGIVHAFWFVFFFKDGE